MKAVKDTGTEGNQVMGKYLSIDQAERYLGLSKWLIYKLCENGELKPIVKIGNVKVKGYKFTVDMLDAVKVELL